MDGAAFDAYVRTQLAPTLTCGDVVILDNLNVHKSPRAAKALAERGAWFLFLPKYSPDLNPIEMAFAKRSEEHTSELQSLMRISSAVFCLKKNNYQLHKSSSTSQTNTLHY